MDVNYEQCNKIELMTNQGNLYLIFDMTGYILLALSSNRNQLATVSLLKIIHFCQY